MCKCWDARHFFQILQNTKEVRPIKKKKLINVTIIHKMMYDIHNDLPKSDN